MDKRRLSEKLSREENDGSRVQLALKLQEIFALKEPNARVAALGSLVATMAAPLQDGKDITEDYQELLATLTRLHKLEKSHASIEKLFKRAA